MASVVEEFILFSTEDLPEEGTKDQLLQIVEQFNMNSHQTF